MKSCSFVASEAFMTQQISTRREELMAGIVTVGWFIDWLGDTCHLLASGGFVAKR